MSITFTTPAARLDSIALECWGVDSAGPVAVVATDVEAATVTSAHLATCGECRSVGRMVQVPAYTPAEVNVSNANGLMLLGLLGLAGPDAWAGSVDGADFLGRVLLAEALTPADAGVPARTLPGPGGRVVDCGRRPGYTRDRLADLRALAEAAAAAGSTVDWG